MFCFTFVKVGSPELSRRGGKEGACTWAPLLPTCSSQFHSVFSRALCPQLPPIPLSLLPDLGGAGSDRRCPRLNKILSGLPKW